MKILNKCQKNHLLLAKNKFLLLCRNSKSRSTFGPGAQSNDYFPVDGRSLVLKAAPGGGQSS